MSTLNIWQNSRYLRLGLTLTFSLALLLGLLLTMGAARSINESGNILAAQAPALQNDPPDAFPVITHTASQQWVGISGDCVVFHDDRDGDWNIYLHHLSSGKTFTVTADEPELRKVVISQGVVVWRSDRVGAEGLWGYYDPTCSDAGPFTATETITPFYIVSRANAHAPALSGEMVTFDTWDPAGAWYIALIELDADNNGIPDATEHGYDPTDENLLIRLSCCAGGPHVTFYQRLSDVYWDDDYRVACWAYNRTDGVTNHLECVDLHHYQDPPLWDHSFVVNTDTLIGPKDYGGIISIFRDLVVWTGRRDAAVSGYDLYIVDLDPDDDGVIDTEGLQEFALVNYPWDQEYPDIGGFETSSDTWQIFAAWVDRRNSNQQDIYAYDLSLDSDGDGLPNWQDPDRFCVDPAEFPVTLHPAAQTGPELWGDTIVWEDNRDGNWDIYSATLQAVGPQPRAPITGTAQEKALSWLDQHTALFSQVQDVPGYVAASGMITRYKSFTQLGFERVRKAWYSPTVGSFVVGYDYCYYGTPDQKRYLGRYGRGFTYDQGLALIARTMLSQPVQAQDLGRHLSGFQNSGQLSTTITGSFGFSFNGQGYWGEKDNFYDMDYLRTGANAWLGYGLLFYARQYSDTQFMDVITRVADYILAHQVLDPGDMRYGLFSGGFGSWSDDEFIDQDIGWAATEHNIDVYFFLRDLGQMTGDNRYSTAAALLRANMPKLWDETKGRLNQGMKADGALDTNDALDAASWGAIYWVAVGDLEKARRSLEYADDVYSNTVPITLTHPTLSLSFWGYKPYSDTTDVVWSEGSLGVAMAHLKLGHALLGQGDSNGNAHLEKAQDILAEMERLQGLDPNGGLLYAVSKPAIADFPQAPSAAGTTWLLMVQQALADETMRDAFWGSDLGDAGCFARLNDGNVYLTVQEAVDASAQPTDVVKVAGYCAGVNTYGGLAQIVYLSKTLTLRGGYTTTNWNVSNPISYPTLLDAQDQGRGLYIISDPLANPGQAISPTVEGLQITGGNASGLGGDPDAGCQNAGGGVYVITAAVVLSDNYVLDNVACDGGGLYLRNSANAILSGNVISDNTGYNYAGGAYFRDSPGARLITNTISNNTANFAGPGTKHCGGMRFVSSDDATLTGNTISGNYTANSGGGACFYRSDYATLVSNTVVNNIRFGGWSGSGIGLHFRQSQNVRLVDNVIEGNTGIDLGNLGAILGGGLCIYDNSSAELTNNTIKANHATRGGGLYVSTNSVVTLTSNTIISNAVYDFGYDVYEPVGYGGGIYLGNSAAILTNNVVADNQTEVAGSGSGLYVRACSCTLLHTTIARNGGGDGSGITITDTSSVAMTNTILVSHVVGINVTAGNTATLEATLWGTETWANLTDWSGAGAISTGTINLQGDPDFVNSDAGDYHIGSGSAARNTGIDAGVSTDVDGDPRPTGAGFDIGADEVRVVTLDVNKRASPNSVQAGESLTYTLRVTNTGDIDLHATITDTLPSHITPGETPGGTLIVPGSVLTWTPTISAPGGVWMETVVVTVEKDYAGWLTNVVQVNTAEGATGVYTETSEVQVTPALRVTKQANPDPVQAGALLTYTLRVTNTGNVDLHATITDTLPSHVAPGGVLTWTEIILTPSGVWTETVVVTVETGYKGPLINKIHVTTYEGATGMANVTICVDFCPVYLPLILRQTP